MLELAGLEEALRSLGALLESRGHSYRVVVAGGGSLLLLGLVNRPTADLDILAFERGDNYGTAEPLPAELVRAVTDVALALDLDPAWMNNGPSQLLDLGLPPGFRERVTVRKFGGLDLLLPGREDLVAFKLYAAVDQGPRSKHFLDLQKLDPTEAELLSAARWTTTQDPSAGFRRELLATLHLLGLEAHDAL